MNHLLKSIVVFVVMTSSWHAATVATHAFTTGNLLTDPGWDTPLTNPLNGYIPVFSTPIYNTWGAEGGAVVGPEFGVTPLAGNGMLRVNQVPLVASQTMQLIDITAYALAIDLGLATVDFSAWFNVPDVLGGASGNISIQFRDTFETYFGPTISASSSSFGGFDGLPSTWEQLAISNFTLPVGVRKIHAEVAYANTSLSPNFPGYVDVADLRLTIVPEPSSYLTMLSGCLAYCLGRRRG